LAIFYHIKKNKILFSIKCEKEKRKGDTFNTIIIEIKIERPDISFTAGEEIHTVKHANESIRHSKI
jgi:hypothetical protein